MMFLATVHLSDDFDPSTQGEEVARDIHALNEEIEAAGALFFACGLQAASLAKTVRPQAGGKMLVTDGPYLETKEHTGGFLILKVASLEEALEWGRRSALACRAPVEVRQIYFDEG